MLSCVTAKFKVGGNICSLETSLEIRATVLECLWPRRRRWVEQVWCFKALCQHKTNSKNNAPSKREDITNIMPSHSCHYINLNSLFAPPILRNFLSARSSVEVAVRPRNECSRIIVSRVTVIVMMTFTPQQRDHVDSEKQVDTNLVAMQEFGQVWFDPILTNFNELWTGVTNSKAYF